MLVLINSVEQRFTSNGREYRHVQGTTEKDQDTTKIVFDNLADKWGLLVEGDTVDFKMKQSYKDGKANWNVTDILPVEQTPDKEPAQFYKQPEPEAQPEVKFPPKTKETIMVQKVSPPKPVSPTAETPPKTEKAKVSKEILFKDIISLHTMLLSYAKDQVIAAKDQILIDLDKQDAVLRLAAETERLADYYVEWGMKKLSKWL